MNQDADCKADESGNLFHNQKALGCKRILLVKPLTLDGLMIAVMLVFMLLLSYVYTYKDHPGVRSRSPLLILIGGTALMCDSMLNFAINISSDPACQCFIGIFTTIFFHYSAWIAIYLRAYRIGKFFDIYEKFLDKNEKEQLQNSVLRLTITTRQEQEEDIVLKDFEQLQETRYIKKHMIIFIGVISSVGIASFFVPPLFSIVPVYETEQCTAYFTGASDYKLMQLSPDSLVFKFNVYSYLVLNWLELVAIV